MFNSRAKQGNLPARQWDLRSLGGVGGSLAFSVVALSAHPPHLQLKSLPPPIELSPGTLFGEAAGLVFPAILGASRLPQRQ